VDGTAVTPVVFATDHATTMALIATQIEADITGATAVVSAARVITITIEDGVDRVVTAVVTLGASQAGASYTYNTTMVFGGFSLLTQQEAAVKTDLDGNVIDASTALYAYKEAANVMIEGYIYGVASSAVDSKMPVYVVKTGANQGSITDVVGSNVLLSGVVFDSTLAAAGNARVRLNK